MKRLDLCYTSLGHNLQFLTARSIAHKNRFFQCQRVYQKSSDSSIVQQQRDQIASLESLLKKTIESQQETLNSLMGKVGNTTNTTNNTINNMQINFFLNEECKNAMNITDFINSLQLSLEDLLYTRDNGYIKGITNIPCRHIGFKIGSDGSKIANS